MSEQRSPWLSVLRLCSVDNCRYKMHFLHRTARPLHSAAPPCLPNVNFVDVTTVHVEPGTLARLRCHFWVEYPLKLLWYNGRSVLLWLSFGQAVWSLLLFLYTVHFYAYNAIKILLSESNFFAETWCLLYVFHCQTMFRAIVTFFFLFSVSQCTDKAVHFTVLFSFTRVISTSSDSLHLDLTSCFKDSLKNNLNRLHWKTKIKVNRIFLIYLQVNGTQIKSGHVRAKVHFINK